MARVELAYGEWLRRSQRRVDARIHLRRALETFHDVRAQWLASRADSGAAGLGRDGRASATPRPCCSSRRLELKIAQLVSSGMSNKDVAAQCWISPRRWPSTCATSSPRQVSPRAASWPGSTWTESLAARPPHPGHLTGVTFRRPTTLDRSATTHHCKSEKVHEHRRPPPRPIERHEPRSPTSYWGRPRIDGRGRCGRGPPDDAGSPGRHRRRDGRCDAAGLRPRLGDAPRASPSRTSSPQPWAVDPGGRDGVQGAALMAVAPSDYTMTMLTWVWPPLALALSVWMYVRMRRGSDGSRSVAGHGRAGPPHRRLRGRRRQEHRHRLLRQHLSGAGRHPLRG